MVIHQVYFQNNSIVKQNQQQNVAVSPVATSSVGDTVEISSKKKENKTLKYTLIGVGTLLGIIALINHKNIVKIFKKASDVEPNIKLPSKDASKKIDSTSHHLTPNNHSAHTPSGSKTETSLPKAEGVVISLEDVLKASNIDSKIIEGSKDKNYQLWHFTSPVFFKKFIEMHGDLSEFYKKSDIHCVNIIDLRNKINDINRPNREKYLGLVHLVKEKTGVDLLGEFRHYRFISQGELDAIKTKQPVINKTSKTYSYVTLCPDYGLSCNTFDYRVTYKNTPNVLENLDHYHDTQYKNGITKPYSCEDVEKVEKIVDGKWQEVEFLSN